MRILLPYLALYKRHKLMLTLGIILAITTLLFSSVLLILSGWFLSASAIVGIAGIYSFNYMLPAAGMRAIAIIRTTGRYVERLISHEITFRVLQYLRVFTFSHLIPLSPIGLASFRQGELLTHVINDIDTLDHLYLRVVSPLTSAFVVILVLIIGLSILDLTLAVMLGSIVLTALFLLIPFFYLTGKPVSKNLTILRSEYRQQLTSWLQSQADLMLFSASRRYRKRIDKIELNLYEALHRLSNLIALSQALMTMIGGITITVTLWIASGSVKNNQQPGELIALFVFCALAIFEALVPVIGAFQYLSLVIASATRITLLTTQLPEVKFTKEYTLVPTYVVLRFKNVTFSYNGQLQPALKDLTLDIAAGEHIAILGHTGCGKSTLLLLLTHAWKLHQGSISINEIPLTNFSEPTLRLTISVATLRVHLFNATLRNNLLLAAPEAKDAQLSSILEQVGLQKLLEGEGLNSWLGEGGRQLSGGELHRLAIARVLLHDAPLMLLDEPTEGLDTVTENMILDLLKLAMNDKTVLMVTHRLRGLLNFDRIVVMDNGLIIEQGSHEELLIKHGSYYQFSNIYKI